MTIEGSNLGLKEDDVRGKIRIGTTPCDLTQYEVSVRIVCRTGPAGREMSAPVIVGNDAGFTESTVSFSYKVLSLILLFYFNTLSAALGIHHLLTQGVTTMWSRRTQCVKT